MKAVFQTIFGDRMNDSLQQLVASDDVQQVEREEENAQVSNCWSHKEE